MGTEKMGRDADAWFEELLRIAGGTDADLILSNDEAFRAFLKANPMTRQEEIFSEGALDRVKARLRGRLPAVPPPPPASVDLSGLELADMRALHRKEGEIPPDVREKLDDYRRKIDQEKRDRDQGEDLPPNESGRKT